MLMRKEITFEQCGKSAVTIRSSEKREKTQTSVTAH